MFEKFLPRGSKLERTHRLSINEISGCQEGIGPEFGRHVIIEQESQTWFHYVSVFMFSTSILFGSIWERYLMKYTTVM